jgi:hypothetical protein
VVEVTDTTATDAATTEASTEPCADCERTRQQAALVGVGVGVLIGAGIVLLYLNRAS